MIHILWLKSGSEELDLIHDRSLTKILSRNNLTLEVNLRARATDHRQSPSTRSRAALQGNCNRKERKRRMWGRRLLSVLCSLFKIGREVQKIITFCFVPAATLGGVRSSTRAKLQWSVSKIAYSSEWWVNEQETKSKENFLHLLCKSSIIILSKRKSRKILRTRMYLTPLMIYF